jgi:hypothetical protein
MVTYLFSYLQGFNPQTSKKPKNTPKEKPNSNGRTLIQGSKFNTYIQIDD